MKVDFRIAYENGLKNASGAVFVLATKLWILKKTVSQKYNFTFK